MQKEKINIVWKEKKGRGRSNRMMLIHPICKHIFFKNNTLTRCTVLQTDVVCISYRMDEKFFLKKI